MGIDWEFLLGADGENLADAYNDALDDDDDWGGSRDDFDDYGDESEGDSDEELLDRLKATPLYSLTDEEKVILGDHMTENNNTNYIIKVLDGVINNVHDLSVVNDISGNTHPAADRLFHANSVISSINYIRNRKMLSRQRGEELAIQTAQNSDDVDRCFGIFNDIFFDNVDIPSVSGTNQSAYGPVMFVFRTNILCGRKVRILKCNPWAAENKEELRYDEVFFDIHSMSEEIRTIGEFNFGRIGFLSNFGHHTTVFNTPELDFGDNLECLLVEKHCDGRENELADLLKRELAAAGLNVPVFIRQDAPSRDFGFATDYEELWRFPE